MSKVIILLGLPGSGKTTYARYCERYLGCEKVIQDELFQIPSEISHRARMILGVIDAVNRGHDVVVDGTFVTKQRRAEIETLARELEAEVEICVMDKTLEDCIERNESKQDRIKAEESTIRWLNQIYAPPTEDECDTIKVIDSEWEESHSKRIKTIVESDDKYRKLLCDKINERRKGNH